MVLTRRICLTIIAYPVGDHFPHSRDLMFDSGVIVWEGGGGGGMKMLAHDIKCHRKQSTKNMYSWIYKIYFLSYQAWNGNVSNSRNSREEKKSGCPLLR